MFASLTLQCKLVSYILLTIQALFIAAEYAKLPLLQPYMFPGNHEYVDGVNFASGGAGALVETNKGLVCHIMSYLAKMILTQFLATI